MTLIYKFQERVKEIEWQWIGACMTVGDMELVSVNYINYYYFKNIKKEKSWDK